MVITGAPVLELDFHPDRAGNPRLFHPDRPPRPPQHRLDPAVAQALAAELVGDPADGLTQLEREVLVLRFGPCPVSLGEIARRVGGTTDRGGVRSVERRALAHLRARRERSAT